MVQPSRYCLGAKYFQLRLFARRFAPPYRSGGKGKGRGRGGAVILLHVPSETDLRNWRRGFTGGTLTWRLTHIANTLWNVILGMCRYYKKVLRFKKPNNIQDETHQPSIWTQRRTFLLAGHFLGRYTHLVGGNISILYLWKLRTRGIQYQ